MIGTAVMIERSLEAVRAFPTFAPIVRIVDGEAEVPAVAEQLAGEVEVLLLYGPAVHHKVKERLSASMPVHYVPLTAAGLYKALFQLQRAGQLLGGVSVDTLTKSMVLRTLHELELAQSPVSIYEGPAYASTSQLTAFHQREYERGASAAAITGVEEVSRELDRLQVPNVWITPTEQDLIVTLERALLSTESRRSKESQVVVGMINVDDFGKLVMQRPSEHEVQRLKLDIHRMVLQYVESLDGYLTAIGGDEYLFFTTRGIFERETGGYKMIPLAKDASLNYGISLSLGIGFGASANEAGTNARMALRKSKEAGGNTCFIVREDLTLIGPLEMSDPMQVIPTPTDAELVKRVAEAGMTSAYLSKLLAQHARTGKQAYMVHELASLLEVTVRTAHRLLLQWIDNGLVEIAGMEKVPKGRPRQIFQFSFLANSEQNLEDDRI